MKERNKSKKFYQTMAIGGAIFVSVVTGAAIFAGPVYITGSLTLVLASSSAFLTAYEAICIGFAHHRWHTVERIINDQGFYEPIINIDEFTIRNTIEQCNINFIE